MSTDIESCVQYNRQLSNITKQNIIYPILVECYNRFLTGKIHTKKDIISICKEYKFIPPFFEIVSLYDEMVKNHVIEMNEQFKSILKTKNTRVLSGVVVITVFTSPYPNGQKFSCKNNCHYCPNEPDQPRSYLTDEPAIRRALQNNFLPAEQFWNRAQSYIAMGHNVDKIELIVSGGTFSVYPREYIIAFFRDLFFAANCEISNRQKKSLKEEQYINQSDAKIKIIGITVETRPDKINENELKFFRLLGVTRVQLGIQHINDEILKHINRGCSTNDAINAIKLLKEAGFKVDIHVMPNLPHPDTISNKQMIKMDENMFEQLLNNELYQADQWKIYPCQIVPYTEINKWYNEKKYIPYADSDLIELLLNVKIKMKPWIRLNRIIRDIPSNYICGGIRCTNLRDLLQKQLVKIGKECKCIRCREVKNKVINIEQFKIDIQSYNASNGIEYFISWINNNILLGFLRLRINTNRNICMSELVDCAIIRELHVYGYTINHDKNNIGTGVQHIGLGKKLIEAAIEITKKYQLTKIAVISGIGVRNYYINQGFTYISKHGYLIKNI